MGTVREDLLGNAEAKVRPLQHLAAVHWDKLLCAISPPHFSSFMCDFVLLSSSLRTGAAMGTRVCTRVAGGGGHRLSMERTKPSQWENRTHGNTLNIRSPLEE